MSSEERLVVDAHAARQRLDTYLAAQKRWGSRARVQRMITQGCVHLDGRVVKPGTVLRDGQTIEVRPPAPEPTARVEPEPIALDVLFEDEWILVINKPAGMVVHPAAGHWRGTLVSALLHHWRGPRPGLDPFRPGIVHRLDKDTSGVLVVAKDAQTLEALGEQFRRREVEKRYLAFAWGRVQAQSGTISEPIGRSPVHRKRMAVRPGGREAVTRFEVVERFPAVTVLRLFPRTGRTHQIRVHLAAMGHPIVGDVVYGRGRPARALVPRQALHAEALAFRHPLTGEWLSFTAPLPPDLIALRRRCADAT